MFTNSAGSPNQEHKSFAVAKPIRPKEMASFLLTSCRMCLTEPPLDALVFSAFDTFQGQVLATLIDELFSIKIVPSDRLLSICLDCVNRVNSVRKVHQLFIESNRKLLAWLQDDSNSEHIQEHEIFEIMELDAPGFELTKPQDGQLATTVPETNEAGQKITPVEQDLNEEHKNPASQLDHKEVLSIEAAYEEELYLLPETASDSDNVSQIEETKLKVEGTVPQNKCYICSTIFENAMQFTQHLPEHFALMPYTCRECNGQVYKSVREASRHIGMHDPSDRPFKCRICSLRFPTRQNSLTHERKIHRWKLRRQEAARLQATSTHKPGKPPRINGTTSLKSEPEHGAKQASAHQCQLCSKTFTAKKNLTRHLMIHTGETPFKCSQCNRTFRQAGELKTHQAVHQSEESHQCELCDKTYRNNSKLSRHKKEAHSQRPTEGVSEQSSFKSEKNVLASV